jgi:hypothetical protein
LRPDGGPASEAQTLAVSQEVPAPAPGTDEPSPAMPVPAIPDAR